MFEFATSVLLLAQAFVPAVSNGTTIREKTTVDVSTNEASVTIGNSVTLEEYVRDYFRETPILIEIAKCESHIRHYNDNGSVLRGRVNNGDIGIMQINKYYHEDDAKDLGMDIYTIDGNLEYAKYLFEKSGDAPWIHSSKCWKNSQLALAK